MVCGSGLRNHRENLASEPTLYLSLLDLSKPHDTFSGTGSFFSFIRQPAGRVAAFLAGCITVLVSYARESRKGFLPSATHHWPLYKLIVW